MTECIYRSSHLILSMTTFRGILSCSDINKHFSSTGFQLWQTPSKLLPGLAGIPWINLSADSAT
jgi:hypothetical protein